MSRLPVAVVCRTSVVLVFLTALALAGTGGWPRLGVGLGLVAVWGAPLLVRRPEVRTREATTTAEGLARA